MLKHAQNLHSYCENSSFWKTLWWDVRAIMHASKVSWIGIIVCHVGIHGIKLLVFNKRMAMKLEASFSLTNINDSVKVIQLPLSKSIICGSQAPRSVWIIVIKYLQRGKISQFSCWKNVRACSSYDLTRGSYSLSPVLPGDVPIQVDGGHDRIQCVTAKPTN